MLGENPAIFQRRHSSVSDTSASEASSSPSFYKYAHMFVRTSNNKAGGFSIFYFIFFSYSLAQEAIYS